MRAVYLNNPHAQAIPYSRCGHKNSHTVQPADAVAIMRHIDDIQCDQFIFLRHIRAPSLPCAAAYPRDGFLH